MAGRKAAQKDTSASFGNTDTVDLLEQKVVAFAEQLGWLVGTVQAKTEGWLDRKTLSEQVSRIRDSAADLLEQVTATRPSRGPVDAPGKRHRKPLPQEPINKRLGEKRGKQMGQKSAKTGRRGGRG